MIVCYIEEDFNFYGGCLGCRKREDLAKMLPQLMKKVIAENPKKVADLVDLVNLPSTLREFMGQSQTSRLGCFKRVWAYIKENNLQVWKLFLLCNLFIHGIIFLFLVLSFLKYDADGSSCTPIYIYII